MKGKILFYTNRPLNKQEKTELGAVEWDGHNQYCLPFDVQSKKELEDLIKIFEKTQTTFNFKATYFSVQVHLYERDYLSPEEWVIQKYLNLLKAFHKIRYFLCNFCHKQEDYQQFVDALSLVENKMMAMVTSVKKMVEKEIMKKVVRE